MTFLFFNLLVNSMFSLLAGTLVVAFFIWFFRIGAGPGKLFLLSLPFLKIVYDFARGPSKDSILYSRVDTFSLPPRHHYFLAGLGVSDWGPNISLQFSAKDLQGNRYAESLGDYLVLWLNRVCGPSVPFAVLSGVAAVSAALVAHRLLRAWQFERARRIDRAGRQSLREERVGFRTVDIYASEAYAGTPFTGGVFRPYICLPAGSLERLGPPELAAVIAHERGHIRQFDLAVTMAIRFLGDLFWFVPGYRLLSRKIDGLREIVADQWAVRSGADPAHLAAALVLLRELPSPDRFALYSAFFRERSLLQVRVNRLLCGAGEPRPRFGWQNRWLRLAVSVWIVTAVMTANLGGNHRTDPLKNPPWINEFLERWGLAPT